MVRALREEAMPATMFAIVRTHGYGKRQFVTLPFVSALVLDPQEMPRRYYTLPPEDEDEPAPEPRRCGNHGAQPRRGGREVIAME